MPILRDKPSNPWAVVAIEYEVFGTTYDQTVEIYKLFVADLVTAIAEICEKRKVRSSPRKCEVRHDL
jgi:hypothetical protein